MTSDDSSVDEVVDVIDMLKGRDDAIDILSEIDRVDRDSVMEIIDGDEEGEGDNTTRDEPSDGQDSSSSESIDTIEIDRDKLSYHNYGIGELDFDTMPIEALDQHTIGIEMLSLLALTRQFQIAMMKMAKI